MKEVIFEENKEPVKEFAFAEKKIIKKQDINEQTITSSNEQKISNYLSNLNELEDVPAFKRKGIKIKEENNTDKSKYSRYTLSEEDGDISLNKNNSYLHDKAD